MEGENEVSFIDKSESLILPNFGKGENSILDLVDLSLKSALLLLFEHSKNIVTLREFKDLKSHLLQSMKDEKSFLVDGIKALLMTDAIFDNTSGREKGLHSYSQLITEIFNDYYKIANEKDLRVKLVTELWVLLSPITLFANLASMVSVKNEKHGDVIIEKINKIYQFIYGIEPQALNVNGFIRKTRPLLRSIEQEDRTDILITLLSIQRENLSVENPSFWLDFVELIIEISDGSSIVELRNAYQFGIKEASSITKFVSELEEAKADHNLQDKCYQNYVDYQFRNISKGALRLKKQIENEDTNQVNFEFSLIQEMESLQQDLILRLNLLLKLGEEIFDSNDLKSRIISCFKEMQNDDQNNLDYLITNILIPIGLMDSTELLQLEPQSKFFGCVKVFCTKVEKLTNRSLSKHFYNRLILTLATPLRIFVLLGLFELKTPRNTEKRLTDQKLNALMQYELLEVEQTIYQKYFLFP